MASLSDTTADAARAQRDILRQMTGPRELAEKVLAPRPERR